MGYLPKEAEYTSLSAWVAVSALLPSSNLFKVLPFDDTPNKDADSLHRVAMPCSMMAGVGSVYNIFDF